MGDNNNNWRLLRLKYDHIHQDCVKSKYEFRQEFNFCLVYGSFSILRKYNSKQYDYLVIYPNNSNHVILYIDDATK